MRRTLALILAVLPAAATAGPPVGINAAIRNQVTMKTERDSALRPAVLKERVSIGDQIATARASVLQVMLLDKSNFTVGANARVTIDKFVYDPKRSASAVGASVAKGAFRFLSGKSVKGMPGQTAIRTPVGSIGVRGTMFEGVVGEDAVRIAGTEGRGAAGADPDKALLVVLRGPAATATEAGGAIVVDLLDGRSVELDRPGMALFVPGPNAAPVGPFALSDKGMLALHDLLRTTPDPRTEGNRAEPGDNPIVDETFEEIILPPQRGVDLVSGQ